MSGHILPTVEIASASTLSEVKAERAANTVPIKHPTYEKQRWPYIVALPWMWVLTIYVMIKKITCKLLGKPKPRINTWWFDGAGLSNRRIKEGAASWKALDIIYNHQFRASPRNITDDFWIGMMNAQAVRNRFKLVKEELRRAIKRLEMQGEVRLISLACGSSQAVIETIAELLAEGVVVKMVLVDVEQSALDYASRLAIAHGVADQVAVHRLSVSQVMRISQVFKPHIIEMLGFLDYIPTAKAVRLLKMIHESLEPGGVFLTCNISPNPERYFLRWVINWPMIYRRAHDLGRLAESASFSNYRLVYEPLKIHCLMIGYKE